MTALLSAQNVSLPGRLEPMSLNLGSGELVAVIGPNGGGKTSLLRALCDIEGDAGRVHIANEDLKTAAPSRRASLIAFLPASRHVVWPIRARDVIRLSPTVISETRIDELVDLFELGSVAQRPINQLSTGERARVLLARALAPVPRLLMLDEPFSNLDPFWVLRLAEILREYVASARSAIVALHDLNQAQAFDRVILIDHGKVVAAGQPEEVLDSAALRDSFNVERRNGTWNIRRPAGRRSSP